jgi:exoribonuclease-2
MNVFYEESGEFKIGHVLADNDATLQIESPHGKRAKVKAGAVLLRFETPAHTAFLASAEEEAGAIDVDFLWQCCGPEEFDHDVLAREYYGQPPDALQSAAVLIRLHGAPMYFYKKGRGRYKAAPEEALKAALASIERKRQEAVTKAGWIESLQRGELPEPLRAVLPMLLYQPDRNRLEYKALEEASAAAKVLPLRMLERCGAVSDTAAYHLGRFLHVHFPKGRGFEAIPAPSVPQDLPLAEVQAYSIDDAETTEIDDAFSLQTLPGGTRRLGIHIAAPALGIVHASPLEALARERLSTVYFPGDKITMLPDEAVQVFSLAEGEARPALSIYVDVAPDFAILGHETRAERVPIAGNWRHDTLESVFNAETLARGRPDHPQGEMLQWLWSFSGHLFVQRKGDRPPQEDRPEFSFRVRDGHVTISRRQRGTPIDQTVAELMILANSTWAADLHAAGWPAIFRVQHGGKVRTSVAAGPHDGLGVPQYLWATSPLRRYADLVNQRQLLAFACGGAPVYQANDTQLLAAMRDFDVAYDAYADFQRQMERYWSLRWLMQEQVRTVTATVLRENLVRLDALPIVQRVPSLPADIAAGNTVSLTVDTPDLLELGVPLTFERLGAGRGGIADVGDH